MNYEQLLDEIMVNTLSAKELIWTPQKELRYAVCPPTLEFHTTIFLASALLALNQNKPIICLIQVDELPEPTMVYTGKIGPHFGRIWDLKKRLPKLLLGHHLPQCEANYYPYLDKLFSYLAVINTSESHLVLFIKKGEKNKNLSEILRKILHQNYSLLVMSTCYTDLPTATAKEKSESLISHILKKKMSLEEERNFPALSILSNLLDHEPQTDAEQTTIEHIVHTGEIGLDTEHSSTLRFMMR